MSNENEEHIENKKRKKSDNRFFLACEYRPGGQFWNIIEPFAYEIKPCYTPGLLGIISYGLQSYSLVDISKVNAPVFGYIMTITHPDTIMFLDNVKRCFGFEFHSSHERVQIIAHHKNKKKEKAWTYMLSAHILNLHQQIEIIEDGIYDDRQELIDWAKEFNHE
jgi:hypothetical protein